MRRDVEFAEEYGEGVQTVDRVRKTKVGQNVHQGDSSSVHASPTGAQRHRPSDVVEAASARVAGLDPNG